ncbi:magnesium transporter [Acidihalobacter ferrooxydans]|uniref:Magnesium transporter MgtE n=1 Tax=Acidihalobacter ferrooxydans TaxID=1765967 RepID=A0A1P8UJD4_9GAMM|nr:magnesium transporter [Acidihalobacter ferrooxydans]APZ43947.1 magnesium transporter [Acidihalobacter ferrooxydans]
MADAAPERRTSNTLQRIGEILQSGTMQEARRLLNALHPAEIAHLLESMPPAQRELVWELVDPEYDGEVLLHLGDDVRQSLIEGMDAQELIQATEGLDVDDLADLVQDLPETVLKETLKGMDKQRLQRLEAVLLYPEDSAGGLMDTDTVTVRADVSLDVVLRYLRLRGALPDATDTLIVVNRYDRYLGLLPLSALLINDPDHTVAEVMAQDIDGIPAQASAREVAKIFEDRDLVSAAVIDEQGKLLGRITIDDVVDVIREEADHSVMGRAGLSDDEDIFAPVLLSSRRRAVWLGINLATAFLAAGVIGLFEGTIEKSVELAVLMPIVASMGGIAGSQTLTLVVRGLALDQVAHGNLRWIFRKEVAVGALNGMLWALVVALIAIVWFGNYKIGGIIALAMMLNLAVAALVGVGIPLVLRRLRIDPAIAGGVILTTFTDVIGYASFLGLATLLLFTV